MTNSDPGDGRPVSPGIDPHAGSAPRSVVVEPPGSHPVSPEASPPQSLPSLPPGDGTPPGSLSALIERVALGGNAENLERLLLMEERWLARRAREAFATDFVRMKPHLPRVIKTHPNTQTQSRYAKLEDINQIIDPILCQYGFGTASKIISQAETMITIRCDLWHRNGHIESTELSMPPDDRGPAGKVNKTMPHAISSTVMYLRRVGFCALLNISTGDDNDGNLPGATITEEQIEVIMDLIPKAQAGPRFLRAVRAKSVEEMGSVQAAVATIEARRYPEALQILKEQIEKREAASAPPVS